MKEQLGLCYMSVLCVIVCPYFVKSRRNHSRPFNLLQPDSVLSLKFRVKGIPSSIFENGYEYPEVRNLSVMAGILQSNYA